MLLHLQQRIPRIQRNDEISVRKGQILDVTRQHYIKTRNNLARKSLHGLRNTSRIHSLLCDPQMEVKHQIYQEDANVM